jgi:hypothetical protein
MDFITATIDPPPTRDVLRFHIGHRRYQPATDRITSGLNHATRPGDVRTACGLDTTEMHLFADMLFENCELPCPGCTNALR